MPVIEVSGRLHAVEVRYRPVERDQVVAPGAQQGADAKGARTAAARDKRDLMEAIVDGVDEVCRIGSGDVLVFLPGEREIRDAAEAEEHAFYSGRAPTNGSKPSRTWGPTSTSRSSRSHPTSS